MQYKVRLSMVRYVYVVVEAESPFDAEDAACDLYYRGNVSFPEGSPSLEARVIEAPK